MATLIGPRGGPIASVDTDYPVADGLCDFSKLANVDLSGADLDLFPGDPRPRGEIRVVAAMSGGVDSSGVVALMAEAHKKWGKLPWATVNVEASAWLDRHWHECPGL